MVIAIISMDQECISSICPNIAYAVYLGYNELQTKYSSILKNNQFSAQVQAWFVYLPSFYSLRQYNILNKQDYAKAVKKETIVAFFRNGLNFNVLQEMMDQSPQQGASFISNGIGLYLNLMGNTLINAQTTTFDIFSEQSQVKLKSFTRKLTQFCLYEGSTSSIAFKQGFELVSEDIDEIGFMYKNNATSETPTIQCFNKYYPHLNYTFPSSEEMTYSNLMKFILVEFLYTTLPDFNNGLLQIAYSQQIPLIIYVRDITEKAEREIIDFQFYEAKLEYELAQQIAKKESKDLFKPLIFAVSDIKEGFNKELFDSINLYDFHLPFLFILDNSKISSVYKRYVYPALDSFTFTPSVILESNEILKYAIDWNLDLLKPYYRNEVNVEQALDYHMFNNTDVQRLNSKELKRKLTNPIDAYKVNMFCSLFYAACIDDLPYYLEAATYWKQELGDKIEFYYMDTLNNDNCDQMALVPQVPLIRVYHPNREAYVDLKLDSQRLNQEVLDDFLRDVIVY